MVAVHLTHHVCYFQSRLVRADRKDLSIRGEECFCLVAFNKQLWRKKVLF